MIYNFRTSDYTPNAPYDCCIAGAGPAGITLAVKLAQSGQRVALLEGGDFQYSSESQDLYQCESTGLETWPQAMRLRFLGGTSNHWAGRCKPFTEHDFREQVMENGLPGWPISYDEVAAYLEETKAVLDMSDKEFEVVPNSPGKLGDAFYPDYFALSAPTRFGNKYRKELEENPLIDVFINANLVDIPLEDDLQSIDSFTVKGYDGREESITAKKYIIALGGIENARLLLNCDHQIPGGIGNQSGMVGKCFMEHFNVYLGSFILFDDTPPDLIEYHTTTEFSTRHDVGKSNIAFTRTQATKAYGRTAAAKELLQNAACKVGMEDKLRFFMNFHCPGEFKLTTLTEQQPDAQSNVSLSTERDALGLRRAVIHWNMNERDSRTIRKSATELAKEFARSELGRLHLLDFVLDSSMQIPAEPHSHHMGTTRMSADPAHGVVDKNCRVHGTNNLYVAGSSVFATGGVNPTMPLVQFALRLADHLSAEPAYAANSALSS